MSRPELNAQGEVVGYHGITRETTERKLLEDKVHQLAFFDPLTQLANRRLLNDRLSQALAAGKRTGTFGALMFLDLDNFKPINDRYGHEASDLLLVQVANRLTACVRHVDTVSRVGGDEFVVLIAALNHDKSQSTRQAAALAEKIRFSLSQPYQVRLLPPELSQKMVEHQCTASIGLVVFNGADAVQDVVLRAADAAMYKAKSAGRNTTYLDAAQV